MNSFVNILRLNYHRILLIDLQFVKMKKANANMIEIHKNLIDHDICIDDQRMKELSTKKKYIYSSIIMRILPEFQLDYYVNLINSFEFLFYVLQD